MSELPHVTNPEAIGEPGQTPILQHSVEGCPAHCDDWLYKAVRNNRRLSGLPPQDCTCDSEEPACSAEWCCTACRGAGWAGQDPCHDCYGTGHTHTTSDKDA